MKKFIVDFEGEEEYEDVISSEVSMPEFLIYYSNSTDATNSCKENSKYTNTPMWLVKYSIRGHTRWGCGVVKGPGIKVSETPGPEMNVLIGPHNYYADKVSSVNIIALEPFEKRSDWTTVAWDELEAVLSVSVEEDADDFFNEQNGLVLIATEGAGSNGERKWVIFRNQVKADTAAMNRVKNDIENDPTTFDSNFIFDHVGADDFREYLNADYEETCADMELEDLLAYVDVSVEDWDGMDNAARDQLVNDAVTNCVDSNVDEYMTAGARAYFLQRFPMNEAIVEASRLVDRQNAAQDAIEDDGADSFLDAYDGEAVKLPSGARAYGLE